MYSEAFCKVYNEFGWNYFPEAFGEQLLIWIKQNSLNINSSLDLGCGTGVLCEVLNAAGINARGMDFSPAMIDLARSRCPDIRYEVGDMVTFLPEEKFDLVTCTGDALNHILDMENVGQVFRNVYSYLSDGGYFIFDILSEDEVPNPEPIDLPFSDEVKAQFRISRDSEGHINLTTTVEENGKESFSERITETIHDADIICSLLQKTGFKNVSRSHQLLKDTHADSSTWYIIAKK